MNSLPDRHSDAFPEALKQAREAKNMSYSELARAIGISVVMPSRYENRDNALFSTPSQDTWLKLNDFLTSDKEFMNPLKNFSMDELIEELKRRGATSVQISF